MKLIRKLVSLLIAMAMMMPAFSVAVEAAEATWLSPQPGEQITNRNVEVAVGFNTQSSLKVTRLELWVDGKFYTDKVLVKPSAKGVCSFWWDANKSSAGSHKLQVKIFAGQELVSTLNNSASIGNVVVDSHSPNVKISNIKSGDVLKGNVSVILDVSDNLDKSPIVSVLVDDSLKLITNHQPYKYDLDTAKYSDGTHEVKVFACDNAGNKGDVKVVKVEFKNGTDRPVVAALQVDAQPETIVASEDDAKPVIPPVLVADADKNNAARAQDLAPVDVKPAAAVPVAQSLSAKADSSPVSAIGSISESAPAKADIKSTAPNIGAYDGRPVEPQVVGDPVISELKQMDMSSIVEIRPVEQSVSINAESAMAPQDDAVSVNAEVNITESKAPAAKVAAAQEKTVKVAMLPKPDNKEDSGKSSKVTSSQPAIKKDKSAKLEKSALPASGKLKLRDLFESLDGVLFWDSETRKVMAYAGDMVLELQIGNKAAKVNGKTIRMESAPTIVEGRTIIDASVYHQACAMLDSGSDVASAKN